MVIWKFSASLACALSQLLSARSLWISHTINGTMKPRMIPDRWVINAMLRSSELLPAVGAGGGGVADSGGTLIANLPSRLRLDGAGQTVRPSRVAVKRPASHIVRGAWPGAAICHGPDHLV